MHGENNRRVDLDEAIQVVIFYTTVAVMPDGAVHFAQDLYGHDARLDKAL
jgi:murein L,D-transpeptidase YcbB/YkuD